MSSLIKSFSDSIVDVFSRISDRRNTLAATRIKADRISLQDCYECYLTGLGSKIIKTKVGYAMADTLVFVGGKKDETFYNKKLDKPVKKALRWMAVYGRGIIVTMNSGDKLSKPFDKSKVNEFTQIKVFSGDMVSISQADRDLTSPRYMKPIMYQVRGHTIHHSRVIDFTYIEPCENELPSYRYGGISEFQFVHNQLKHDGIIERASARIIERNSNLFYFVEGFKDAIRNKKDDDVVKYFQVLEDHRSIYGAGLLDKNDDVKSVDQTLTNLSETDQISLRRIAAVTNIPVSELVGENVRGLNSTGDNERSSWHAYIKSWQDDYVYEPLNELTALFGLGEIHFKETQGITSSEQATYEGKVIENAVKLNSMGEDAEAYLADKGIITIDPIGDFLNFEASSDDEGSISQFGDAFKEEDHPRADNGQFGKGGESKNNVKSETSSEERQKKIDSVNIDFSKDNTLPNLNKETLEELGRSDKPVLLKKNIIDKNKNRHPDIEESMYKEIIGQSLYNPDFIGAGNEEKPNYFNFLKRIGEDKSSIVLLELSEKKDNYEIVNLHWIGNEARERKEKKKKS